jgi:hypothetical protein
MSVDYEQLRLYVLEALAVDGPSGMMEPSAPAGVPHRMPAADPSKEEGDPKANKLYDLALVAREATEKLIEALDEPVFDDAYEFAFKATSSLRRVLNSLEGSGAKPTPQQRVVAPSADQQKFAGTASYQGPTASASGGTVFGAHPPGVALSDIAEALENESPAIQNAVKSYHRLSDDEKRLFSAYLEGDEPGDDPLGLGEGDTNREDNPSFSHLGKNT